MCDSRHLDGSPRERPASKIPHRSAELEKLLVFLGLSAGGWIGWTVGAPFGLFAALFLGVIGTASGLYVGRRIARDYF